MMKKPDKRSVRNFTGVKLTLWGVGLVFFICFSGAIYAAQEATVLSVKAAVFADQDLSSPVGYLKEGTKIKIGDNKLKSGDVVTTVFQGKLVYMMGLDLLIQGEYSHRSGDYERSRQKTIEEEAKKKEVDALKENNYFILEGGKKLYGSEFETLAKKLEDTKRSANVVYLHIIHRPYFKSVYPRLGIGHVLYPDGKMGFNYPHVYGGLNIKLYQVFLFSFELTGGLGYTDLFSAYTVENNEVTNYTGKLYDLFYGLEAILFPRSQYSLFFKITNHYSHFLQIDIEQKTEVIPENQYKTLNFNHMNTSLGLMIKF